MLLYVLSRQVKIFKDYTQENCLLECRSRLLLQLCGCLPYYYPRLDLLMTESDVGKNASAECTWLGWQCLKNHTELLDAIKPEFPPIRDHVGSGERARRRREREEEQMRQRETLMKGGAPCQCQPACATTIYGATQSSAGFPNRASRVAAEVLRDAEGR